MPKIELNVTYSTSEKFVSERQLVRRFVRTLRPAVVLRDPGPLFIARRAPERDISMWEAAKAADNVAVVLAVADASREEFFKRLSREFVQLEE